MKMVLKTNSFQKNNTHIYLFVRSFSTLLFKKCLIVAMKNSAPETKIELQSILLPCLDISLPTHSIQRGTDETGWLSDR